MSWVLFLDESGHDHKGLPFEVHGGVAIHTRKLWEFVQAVRSLEQSMFGAYLLDYRSEIKGEKQLSKDRFRWAKQGPAMNDQERRRHALNFLNSSSQKRSPRREEFTAFGQASLRFVERVFALLLSHDAVVFASMIPPVRPPQQQEAHVLRKDVVFLLERYCYFLEEHNETGLLVMDMTEKAKDRRLVRQMERYFTYSAKGMRRSRWIVPSPFFVESDMAYGVQVADLCIYSVNWAYRFGPTADAPVREELKPFAELLTNLVWKGSREEGESGFQWHSVFYIADPFSSRAQKHDPQK